MRHEHNAMVKLVSRLSKRGIPAVIRRAPPMVRGNRYALTITVDEPGGEFITITAKAANLWEVWIPASMKRLSRRPEFYDLVRPPFSRYSVGHWQLYEVMTTDELEKWAI